MSHVIDHGCEAAARRRRVRSRRGRLQGRLLVAAGIAVAVAATVARVHHHGFGGVDLAVAFIGALTLVVRGVIHIDQSTPLEPDLPHRWTTGSHDGAVPHCVLCGRVRASAASPRVPLRTE